MAVEVRKCSTQQSEGAMTKRWLSVDEIADHLGITRDLVYRWIDGEGMPAHRVGRLWKFQVVEVDEWVRSGHASHAGCEGGSPEDTTQLSDIPDMSDEIVAALGERWITTAEQLLSLCGTQEGREGVRRLLGYGENGLRKLIELVSENMPKEKARSLQAPRPGGKRGLLLPEDEEA